MFEEDEDDDFYVELAYTTDQDYISPTFMPAYENMKDMPAAKLFFSGTTPCLGPRVPADPEIVIVNTIGD